MGCGGSAGVDLKITKIEERNSGIMFTTSSILPVSISCWGYEAPHLPKIDVHDNTTSRILPVSISCWGYESAS
jgi:hypothetical protein